MSGRHARDDAIDTAHPARAFLALAAVAVGLPAAMVLHERNGEAVGHAVVPSTVTAADTAPSPE
ncbi:hypothetical protein [Streptomyces sp. NPDC051173]|uniref:hypothetical protein n=1 Tax=Streptomyces sp. NPDC051173 TaxID=3155164 RepID=UPI0034506DE3